MLPELGLARPGAAVKTKYNTFIINANHRFDATAWSVPYM
jgi:hypothetical protein